MSKESFALQVKEELCSNTYESLAAKKAILSAYIRICGVIVIRNKHSLLTLTNRNAKIAKFIYQLILDLFQANAHFEYKRNNARTTHYTISVNSKVDEILDELDVSFLEGKISKKIVYDDETISSYLAGAFLACGSINSPKTSNYHLEFSLNNQNYAKWLSHLFMRYKNSKIEPKIIKRRENYVLYFKKGDQVADFLIMIGAMQSAMDFEGYRIDRDYMNNANRLTNLDTANMSKTVESGKRQIKEIKFLEKKLGKDFYGSKKNQVICELRVEYMSISLGEIAERASIQLNETITKSNVNHILRKIHELYEKNK